MSNPLLYLAASPAAPVSVPTLTRREGVRMKLENPVFTRHDGWNLITYDQARLVAGERLTLSNGTRKHLDLYRDGTFFAFGGFESLFGWRGDAAFTEQPKINPLAVVEFTHDFVLVYESLLEFFEPVPEEIEFSIGIRNAIFGEDSRLYLLTGPHNGINFMLDDADDRFHAPAASFDDTLAATVEDGRLDVPAVTFALVRAIYIWFGLVDEQIPYVDLTARAVNVETLRNPRG
jgi:hypothetical protein